MKKLFKSLLALAALLLPAAGLQAQDASSGDIKVTVLDEKSQPMPGVIVRIVAGGPTLGGQTTLDGNYTFRGLTPGAYDVEARMIGYKRYVKQGIIVSAGQTAYVNYPMQLALDTTGVVYIYEHYEKSPVDKNFSTVHNIDANTVKHMPVEKGNIAGMVVNTCSSCSQGPGGQLVMRGARENATVMFVDGEKLYGSAGVPGGAIEQVSVLSGGIPASYGDMTGGVIIVTTKSFDTGLQAKQTMYEEAAEKRAAEEKAAREKSGEHKETGDEIIEKEQPAQQPAPAQEGQPADGGN